MRAVVVDRVMEPAEARVRQIDAPRVEPHALRIEVRAAGCNFSDILMLQGKYQVKPPLPFVPGREAAGIVLEVGEGVTRFGVGDRVLAPADIGAFAEQLVVPSRAAHPLPEGMAFASAAALPIVYPTSYAALTERARLSAGETLLVHAAAGGVGLAAVQIGKALGARVIATAGGEEKLAAARSAGADVVVDYRHEDFVERVLEETAGRGADVIYESVGGETFDRSLKCIAWKGRLLVIGFASGRIPEVAANRILLKNIAVIGLHWPVYGEREPEFVERVFADLFEMYRRDEIEPLVGAQYPLEEAGRALEALATRRTIGKVVLVP